MGEISSQLFGALIQLLIFSIIPLLWWAIVGKNEGNFLEYIGLKKVVGDKEVWLLTFVLFVIFTILGILILQFLPVDETANSPLLGRGIGGLPLAIIYSFIRTSLSEEILFRGFLLKRMMEFTTFNIANTFQALLFGLLHGAMFISIAGPIIGILIIVFTGTVGWFLGYLNEQGAGGSILPSWIVHGLANLVSSIYLMMG